MTAGTVTVVDADRDVPTGPLTGDGGSVTLTVASAEHLTRRIREVWGLAWDLIQLAYTGRAWEVLGYRSWNAYVEERFGDLAVTVPRDDRPIIVDQLRSTGMSTRAIARVLGVSDGTVRNDLDGREAGAQGYAAGARPEVIVGKDGKPYPATRSRSVPSPRSPEPEASGAELVPCALCGESHPAGTGECPWAAFAAGRGPDPTGGRLPPKPRSEHGRRKRKLDPSPELGRSSLPPNTKVGAGTDDSGDRSGDAPAVSDTPTDPDGGGTVEACVGRVRSLRDLLVGAPALMREVERFVQVGGGLKDVDRAEVARDLHTAAAEIEASAAGLPALASRLHAAAAALDR